jgi:hypothetical protein
MKSVLNILIGLSFLSSTSFARRSGGISDGGGNAVVCRDGNKNIQSATLLDLFEATKVLKLQLIPNDPNKTYLQIALEAAKRIDDGGAGEDVTSTMTSSNSNGQITSTAFLISPTLTKTSTQDSVEYVDKSINLISDVGLSPIDDSNSFIRPKNCEIEQTAIYLDESDEIHVVEDIWDAFDNISKAALLTHEALYRDMRMSGETNSDRVRQAVGYAFAGKKFADVLDGVPSTVTICGTNERSPKYRFAVYEEQPGVAVLQFFWLGGKAMLSKTTVKITAKDSPIGVVPANFDGITSVLNLYESLFDKKLKIALKNERTASGKIKSSLALVGNVIKDDELFSVSCNKTTFSCSDKGCNSSGTFPN